MQSDANMFYRPTKAIETSGPDLAGGRPGAQPNYGSISVTGASLGAHKTRGSRP